VSGVKSVRGWEGKQNVEIKCDIIRLCLVYILDSLGCRRSSVSCYCNVWAVST